MSSVVMQQQMFDVMCRIVKEVTSASMVMLDADEDHPPVLHTENGHGPTFTMLCDYATDTTADKDYLATVVVPELIAEDGARWAALVMPCWAVCLAEDPGVPAYVAAGKSLADHPARAEQMFLLAADESRLEGWQAPVNRRPRKHPTLGRWQRVDARSRFTLPLVKAVRLRTLDR